MTRKPILLHNISLSFSHKTCFEDFSTTILLLLILDEVTNNLDLETRDHVIQVLKAYPGALLAISHDDDFIREIRITDYYTCRNKRFYRDRNLGADTL